MKKVPVRIGVHRDFDDVLQLTESRRFVVLGLWGHIDRQNHRASTTLCTDYSR